MSARVIALVLLMVFSALVLASISSADVDASEIGREAVNPEEMLGAVLNTSVAWRPADGAEGCDRIDADVRAMRRILGLEDCPDELDCGELHAVAIAAIQGLYEQIRKRDEILLELNEQNRVLHRQLGALEAHGREVRAVMARLERRLDTTQSELERQVGSSPLTGPDTQSHQLAQRLNSMETDRRGADSRLNRMETRLDTALSSLENRTRDLQSRVSRLESRMMTMPRN
jgi:hypothetical protein